MALAEPGRVPDPDSARERRAFERMAWGIRALFRSGILVLGSDGTIVLNQTIVNILDGRLDDMQDEIDALEESDELSLDERIGRCENALRFLGVEPNEFPDEDEFPRG